MEYLVHRVVRDRICKCGAAFSGPPSQRVCSTCHPEHRKRWRKKYERRKRALRKQMAA